MTDWPTLDENQTAGILLHLRRRQPQGGRLLAPGPVPPLPGGRLVDTAAISEQDVLLPIVPMFHVNAWGMPFAATWYEAGQVGPAPTPATCG